MITQAAAQPEQKRETYDFISHFMWIPFRVSYNRALLDREQIRRMAPTYKVRTPESNAQIARASSGKR